MMALASNTLSTGSWLCLQPHFLLLTDLCLHEPLNNFQICYPCSQHRAVALVFTSALDFSRASAGLASSLHSGLCSNVTASERPSPTALSITLHAFFSFLRCAILFQSTVHYLTGYYKYVGGTLSIICFPTACQFHISRNLWALFTGLSPVLRPVTGIYQVLPKHWLNTWWM